MVDRVPGGEKPGTESARAEDCVGPGPSEGLPRLPPSFTPNGAAAGTRAAGRVRSPRSSRGNPQALGAAVQGHLLPRPSPPQYLYPGSEPARPGAGGWGGGVGRTAREAPPRPVRPRPPALPSPLGAPGPPLRPGSAARRRVWGLAEGRASLRKATSRPFLQCE